MIEKRDDTILMDGKAVGYIEDGVLKMTRGNAPKRAEVEAFLAGEAEEPVEAEDAEESKPEISAEPEPPKGNPTMGDKDPEVIAWWFRNRPDEAAKRYADRKGTNLDPYLKR